MTDKLVLRYSPTSPFVRKVLVMAHETGLEGRIERVLTLPWDPHTDLPKDNPLGKVPTLNTPEGWLYDSLVICDYLDSLHKGPKMFPPSGPERWRVLRRHALADGTLDAAVLRLVETRRAANEQSPSWIERQKGVVKRGLDRLEAEARGFGDMIDISIIATAVLLGWLDFRFPSEDWRPGRPTLAAWYAKFSQRPSMLATVPQEPK
jgi:glutathione S-transferase